ncbi:ABC transporter ATP-binding protein [Micromonospora inyonensis]|uniref:Iron complex transport system ATP-binding protein n=1 Tax=Micromonospora inyonensis TaxID=47866 RepID=A0A1C6S6Z7_9ACTN|nr:ABC transporter ATP-binding protein [Micromonospora inyonensis]SCL25254.1 iron complex transport system ATP-binding protein [Micromonospora inyonensis]
MNRPTHGLAAEGLTLGYPGRCVVDGLDVTIPPGRVTAIVGANACGKSTLLRGLARLLRPTAGTVHLDGRSINTLRGKELARLLGVLPQNPAAPDGITVLDLVRRGRSPHQSWWRQWSAEDERAVEDALTATGLLAEARRSVDELSGGQRQRAWIAMALAQDTGVLLLDEPTNHLDLAHQIEILDLIADLNRTQGRTVVLVLHDLNHAARYADHVIAMVGGGVVAAGSPGEVITRHLVETVFGLACVVVDDPVSGGPHVVPYGRHHRVPVAH